MKGRAAGDHNINADWYFCSKKHFANAIQDLGAVHMSRASPANRADSIISRPMVA